MSFTYLKLFQLSVSIQLDNFHAVSQGCRNGFQLISGCNKYHVTQVKIDIQIVIAKR